MNLCLVLLFFLLPKTLSFSAAFSSRKLSKRHTSVNLFVPNSKRNIRSCSTKQTAQSTQQRRGSNSRSYNKEKVKDKSLKKSLPDGYSFGNNDSLKQIFVDFSAAEGLTFFSLENSKYLRFWPGTIDEAKALWEAICGPDIEHCSLGQLLEFHSLLDISAGLVFQDMENERIQWQEENLVSDMLESFFYLKSSDGLLDFSDFITWEVIKAELWYLDVDPKSIMELWKSYANSSNKVNYSSFRKMYTHICKDNLNLYSSNLSEKDFI